MLSTTKPTMYYDRLIHPDIEASLLNNFNWLVPYVKMNSDLDFQTGAKYISVYRGTSRIVTLKSVRGKVTAEADDYYRKKFSTSKFYNGIYTQAAFDELVQMVRKDLTLSSYYVNTNSANPIYNEGYYQNIISRRYSLFSKSTDDFIIFDKEFEFGYLNTETRDAINLPISNEITAIFNKSKSNNLSSRFPSKYKASYKECDFIALNKNGDIILLELKSDNTSAQKIYLAPLQVAMYCKLTEYYMTKFKDTFEKTVFDMVAQKQRLGMIDNGWKMPTLLSGKILNKVIVGTNPFDAANLNNSIDVKTKSRAITTEVRNAGFSVDWYTSDSTGQLVQASYP